MSPPVGLVLEGGGMRAAYSAGVLDCFMDQRVDIPYVVGVSAGANAGSNYVVGQRERNHALFVDFVRDRRYQGIATLVSERSWFGMKFLFETLPDRLLPFDYEAFRGSPRTFTVCVTRCADARPTYFRQADHDPREFVRTIMRASSSLPVLSPPVSIGGAKYCDGGVSDPIPIERSLADGNQSNIVILTRNAGYQSSPQELGPVSRGLLRRYPAIIELTRTRHVHYNACLARVETLERAGEAFVFRPLRPLAVARIERNVAKLESLYRQGYDEALQRMDELSLWRRSRSA
jgi:predicted patatin/cPLA2 family phospholipase